MVGLASCQAAMYVQGPGLLTQFLEWLVVRNRTGNMAAVNVSLGFSHPPRKRRSGGVASTFVRLPQALVPSQAVNQAPSIGTDGHQDRVSSSCRTPCQSEPTAPRLFGAAPFGHRATSPAVHRRAGHFAPRFPCWALVRGHRGGRQRNDPNGVVTAYNRMGYNHFCRYLARSSWGSCMYKAWHGLRVAVS